MEDRRLQSLLAAKRMGFTLAVDPDGFKNRCFYRCLSKSLDIKTDDIVDMLEDYMLSNLVIETVNENGSVEKTDLYQYLSNADFPSLGEVPKTWVDAVLALRDEMANHVVLRSAASLLKLNLHVVDWEGRLQVAKPFSGTSGMDVYLAYTGDHYMLLKKKEHNVHSKGASAPKRKSRKAPTFSYSGEEVFNPGVSVFKGRIITLDDTPPLIVIPSDDEDDSDEFETSTLIKKTDDKTEVETNDVVKDELADSSIDELVESMKDLESPVKQKFKGNDGHEKNTLVSDKTAILVSSDESDQDRSAAVKKKNSSRKKSVKRHIFSVEEDGFDKKRQQKKIGPEIWNATPVVKVKRSLPNGIDGLVLYNVKGINSGADKAKALKSDGRNWKKSTVTQWKGYGDVRYTDCRGSFVCNNGKCPYKVQYGVVNRSQFRNEKDDGICRICETKGKFLPCEARRYFIHENGLLKVYHCGTHTCPVKFDVQKDETVKEMLRNNPGMKPSEVQSAILVSSLRNKEGWDKIEKNALQVVNKKWIDNEKQKIRKEIHPAGENFEALVNFKEYSDEKDPLLVYKVNDRRGNPDLPSFVF